MPRLRQPILSLLGHVDHGKTTLLDRIAGSAKAEKEAGGITQHIGAIGIPGSTILKLCEGILKPAELTVPGLLIIDTPGHRSFETMRRRGGALADIAVLVVDAREGVMPQTRESVQILRHEKTPFAVALTKIDLLSGWRKPTGPLSLAEQIVRCGPDFGKALDARVYAVAEEVVDLGFSAERYDRVSDFTRNVGIVPVSSKAGVGVPELLALVVGLAQRFLKVELGIESSGGEATILERSDQKGIGPVGSVILYSGRLSVGDDVLVTGLRDPFSTRIRGLYRPGTPGRGSGRGGGRLEGLTDVEAAAGIYLAAPGIEDAMPGGLLKVVRSASEATRVREELVQESHPVAELADSGVAIAADTLGGLEALAFECREAKIPIHQASVGPVDRPTVLKEATVKDPTHRAALAFNVPVLPDARPEGESSPVRVFSGEVMYHLIEEYQAWRTERVAELNAERRLQVVHPAKFQVLPGFIFRSSKPAIVGIKILAGTLRTGVRLIQSDGAEVGVLRSLQKEGVSATQAEPGEELAASIEGAVVGRNLAEGDVLLVSVPESAARLLSGTSLSPSERDVLAEVIRIRRQSQPFWGQ
ncbi:MAG: translation initiation factor IF-2 [Thermoplasmata archaeon]